MLTGEREKKLAKYLLYFGILFFIFSLAAAIFFYFEVENFFFPAIFLIIGGLMIMLLFMSLSANLKILIDIKNLLKKN